MAPGSVPPWPASTMISGRWSVGSGGALRAWAGAGSAAAAALRKASRSARWSGIVSSTAPSRARVTDSILPTVAGAVRSITMRERPGANRP